MTDQERIAELRHALRAAADALDACVADYECDEMRENAIELVCAARDAALRAADDGRQG